MPSFEHELLHSGLVAGVDEAGCGPWAGPVVAAACCFTTYDLPDTLLKTLNDSKKLSEKKRLQIFDILHELRGTHCIFEIAQASVEEVDRLNIRQAALLAMHRALTALPQLPIMALVDGISVPKGFTPCMPMTKGDSISFSIAAASILAKVTRDHIMCDLAKEYPGYGWEKNMGYGTAAHQAGLALYGITPHHRLSFAPIALLKKAA